MVEKGKYQNSRGLKKEILNKMYEEAEPEYKKFNARLMPGVDEKDIIGVRLPKLRKMAKEIAKSCAFEYLSEIKDDCYFEERMLYGMILGYSRLTLQEFVLHLPEFVSKINDWSVCDSGVTSMKIFEKYPEEGLKLLKPYLESGEEFAVRFGVVVLLRYYTNEKYVKTVLKYMRKIDCSKYYIMMAVSWCVAECYIKFPELTEGIFIEEALDVTTNNKAIQKIRESLRVERKDKERLNQLKRIHQ